jgi:sterol desaturase/sphingolipid hydroxylase (fatty acid hydroxylase superfamily)
MIRPVHFIHHKNHMWHTNFGIGVDIWDRVFGTYRLVEWKREKTYPLWDLLTIKWI